MSQHTALGQTGELLARAYFERNGYRIISLNTKFQGDFTVVNTATGEVIRIEVKTAKANRKTNIAQFCAFRDGRTDTRHSDLTVMIGVDTLGLVHWYFVPSCEITAKTVKINLWHWSKNKYNNFRKLAA